MSQRSLVNILSMKSWNTWFIYKHTERGWNEKHRRKNEATSGTITPFSTLKSFEFFLFTPPKRQINGFCLPHELILQLIFYLYEHSTATREQFHRKASICCNRLIVCLHFFLYPKFFFFFSSGFIFSRHIFSTLSLMPFIVDICVHSKLRLSFETHANFQQVFYGLASVMFQWMWRESLIRGKAFEKKLPTNLFTSPTVTSSDSSSFYIDWLIYCWVELDWLILAMQKTSNESPLIMIAC